MNSNFDQSNYLIDEFIAVLIAENGLSKNTVTAYKSDLLLLDKFLLNNNCCLVNASENVIRKYLQELYCQAIKPSSLNRKISTIKLFFKFLVLQNQIKTNPSLNIDHVKNHQKLPKFLSEKEVFLMLNFVNQDNSPFGVRLSCMLEILYASGLRVSELVALPISAIGKNFDQGKIIFKNYLIVNGKGNKERIAPLNQPSLKVIEKYLKVREEMGQNSSKWLFCGNHKTDKKELKVRKINKAKKGLADEHLTRQRLNQMLKELADKVGIDKNKVSPHIIRHSFASHLLKQGIDLRVLQELLGHSDISSTQIYTHIMSEDLKKLVFDKHPLSLDVVS